LFSILEQFEDTLVQEINQEGNYVIANIMHALIEESGGGHFSPLGAYHEETSRFLFLDTARYKFPYVWVRSSDLFAAMKTIDSMSKKSRGFIVISALAIKDEVE